MLGEASSGVLTCTQSDTLEKEHNTPSLCLLESPDDPTHRCCDPLSECTSLSFTASFSVLCCLLSSGLQLFQLSGPAIAWGPARFPFSVLFYLFNVCCYALCNTYWCVHDISTVWTHLQDDHAGNCLTVKCAHFRILRLNRRYLIC